MTIIEAGANSAGGGIAAMKRACCLLIALFACVPTLVNSAVFAKVIAASYDSPDATPARVAIGIRWYTRAAQMGDGEASRILGNHYFSGQSGVTDFRQAAFYWKRAADAGDVEGEAALGDAYCMGIGVVPNGDEAQSWWNKAAAQGNAHAAANLKAKQCSGALTGHAQRKPRSWIDEGI
jgi:TPR repeat protein